MKITELIKSLECLQNEHGDLNVEVQYRDGGGNYSGTDTDVTPFFSEDKWGKAIIL